MATREMTLETLQETVAANDIVLLDFWAAWCGPCRAFAPVFEQAALDHPEVVFGKVDTEAQQDLAAAFRITSIPTLVAFREGVVVHSQPGALGASQLERLVSAVQGLDMADVHAQIEAQQKEARR